MFGQPVRAILVAGMFVVGLAGTAAAWPEVTSKKAEIKQGVWSGLFSSTKSVAKKAGVPYMAVIADSAESGVNAAWDAAVLQDGYWQDWLEGHRLYLCLWDRSGEEMDELEWLSVASGFTDKNNMIYTPQVVLYDASGRKVDQFYAGAEVLMNVDAFTERLECVFGRDPNFVVPGPGVISLRSQSVDGTNAVVTVVRSGGTAQGAHTVQVRTYDGTASNGVDYVAASNVFSWAEGDVSERTFVVPLLRTRQWQQPDVITFGVALERLAGDAKLGTTNMTVSLAGSLSADEGWFYDAGERVLFVEPTTNAAPLTAAWVAPDVGLLTFAGSLTGTDTSAWVRVDIPGTAVTNFMLLTNGVLKSLNTVAVAAGQEILWQASVSNATAAVQLQQWQPLAVVLRSPDDGQAFLFGDVSADPSKLALRWDVTPAGQTDSAKLYSGATAAGVAYKRDVTNGVTAVEAGLVAADETEERKVFWRVASDIAVGFSGSLTTKVSVASGTVRHFVVTGRPAFGVAATNVTLRAGMPAEFAFPARGEEGMTLAYAATGLPAGLVIDATSGAVTGVTEQVGTFDATVTVADSQGRSSALPVNMTVVESAFGVVGFATSVGAVHEGQVYTGRLLREGGADGAAQVAISVTGGYAVEPAVVAWQDGEEDERTFAVTGIAATDEYDRRVVEVTLAVSGAAAAGVTNQAVTVLDSQVTQTLEEYAAGRVPYEPLALEEGFWFYSGALDALRTEPLGAGERTALGWTAPEAGVLTFTWGVSNAVAGASGTLSLVLGDETNRLDTGTAELTVGVSAGGVVRWGAQGEADGYVAFLKDLAWEPLKAVAGSGMRPSQESVYRLADVQADTNLLTLAWQAAEGLPAHAAFHLYAGSATNALAAFPADGMAVASNVNAVALGVVDLAEPQGWIYWRVDTVAAGDYGVAVAEGPVWRFAVLGAPQFDEDVLAPGAMVDAYLKAGASITVGVESVLPVTYSAAGLPSGLTLDRNTGVISGTAKRAGTYAVVVTVTDSEGVSSTLPFTIQVQTLPAHVRGIKLQGVILENAEPHALAGTLTFSVSSAGRISAKAQEGVTSHSMTGYWDVAADGGFSARLVSRAGGVLEVALAADGMLSGAFNGKPVLAKAAVPAEVAPYQGYYTAALPVKVLAAGALDNRPEGAGYMTVTTRGKGQVKYSGMLADGTRLSGSATLLAFSGGDMQAMGYAVADGGAYACFPVYKTLYGRRGGVVAALAWIDATGKALWLDNTRWYYPGKSVALTADAFEARFDALEPSDGVSFSDGAVKVGGWFEKRQDLQVLYSGVWLSVDGAVLPVTASRTALALDKVNERSAKLKASALTGLYSGSFKREDLATGRMKSVTYKGVLTVLDGQGVGAGYWLWQDAATGSYRLKRSYPADVRPGTVP